jgi:hypothetical protein
VAPLEDQEDSQSYYSEHSDEDGEELKKAYKILYVKFEKLRETRKQHIHELNSLQTEKSSLLLKIQDLEDKLLETQLQLERVTNEKLTHILSIHKSLTDKTGLGYVALPLISPLLLGLFLSSPQSPSLQPPSGIKERKLLVEIFRLLQRPLIISLPLNGLLYATTVV